MEPTLSIELKEEGTANIDNRSWQEIPKKIFQIALPEDFDALLEHITLNKPKPAINIYAISHQKYRKVRDKKTFMKAMSTTGKNYKDLKEEFKAYYEKEARKDKIRYKKELLIVKKILFLNYDDTETIDAFSIFKNEKSLEYYDNGIDADKHLASIKEDFCNLIDIELAKYEEIAKNNNKTIE